MTNELEGGCFCGLVRYRFPKKSYQTGNCYYCRCQRLSVSTCASWVEIPVTEFEQVEEKLKILQSFQRATSYFCQGCGTLIVYVQKKRPDEIAVTLCSLDDPDRYTPTADLYTDTKLAWLAQELNDQHDSDPKRARILDEIENWQSITQDRSKQHVTV